MLATVVLYAPVAHHQFLALDDVAYVPQNPHVSTGLSLANIAWAFTSFYEANWYPLTWISHMVDCQLFGLNPGPPHLVNLAIHAANVILLFFLLRAATGALWRSLFVAALFALHPINVETVAWVAERKSLLSALFSLLTIGAYGWYVQRPNWKRYLPVAALFALALMAKSMAVTLPLALLLLDYWPLDRNRDVPAPRRWLLLAAEKLPLLLLSAASAALAVASQSSGGAMSGGSQSLFVRLETAIVSTVLYIGKMLWPAPLAVYYPHPEHALPLPEVFAAAAVLIVITIAVLSFRRVRYLTVGWFLFLVTLLPVSGIVKVGHTFMADRFAYLPLIGLFIIISFGLGELVRANRSAALAVAAAAVCVLLALTTVTARYLRCWQNGTTLLTHALAVVPPDYAVEEFLANAMTTDGHDDEALPHFQRACQLNPAFSACHYNMAIYYHRHLRLPEALNEYKLTLQRTGDREEALNCLVNSGRIELAMGNYPAASSMLAGALQLDPANLAAQVLLQQAQSQSAQ